jgi:hypothetical protein
MSVATANQESAIRDNAFIRAPCNLLRRFSLVWMPRSHVAALIGRMDLQEGNLSERYA